MSDRTKEDQPAQTPNANDTGPGAKVSFIPGRDQEGRDVVNLSEGLDLRELVPKAWRAIEATNNKEPRLFRFGTRLSRVRLESGGVSLDELGLNTLRFELETRAGICFVKRVERHGTYVELPQPAPRVLLETMLEHPAPPLPALSRVVRVPVFTSEGRLVTTEGYDAASGIYYRPHRLAPISIPSSPTPPDILIARERLLDVVADFPFTSAASRAHAISLLLLPFVRAMIAGPTPLYLVSKPTPATGGTLLVSALLFPALGEDVPRMTASPSEDEMRRTLTAKLDTAPAALFFDNLKSRETRSRDGSETLDSEALSSAITSTHWEDRRIRNTSLVSVPVTCAWAACGNNPQLSREIKRRCVPIHLDARVERPEQRTAFRHPNLRQYLVGHRTALVAAALTLAQAWVAAGGPAGRRTFGMFESWAAVLGGILDVAEIGGFLDVVPTDTTSDDDTEVWRALTTAWWRLHAGREVTGAELLPAAANLLDLGDSDGRSQAMRLGHMLVKKVDRVFSGYQIRRGGLRHNATVWRLEQVEAPQPPHNLPAE